VSPESRHRADRVRVLGLPVDGLDVAGLLAQIDAYVADDGLRTVAYLNVHVANQAAEDPELAAFLDTVDLCYCDGAGIRLGARLLGHDLPERMTGADWIWDLAAHAEGRLRLFWLGGEPGVTDRAAAILRERHPALEITADHGFHDDAATPALLARIHDYAPDVLLVGMGTPVQERWVARWRGELDVAVVWCLGATADFISGKVSRGPAWLHDNAEWLARLVTEPRRLWRRYLIGNGTFLVRIGLARLRGR
jgi:N-acetylglucosaminyldiphosphoundecaprenol N-acetyl-beta-D-mannosaminyltransferase